ncbi:MAG: 3-isopropylmalate dehydrogenase [Thermoanaerobaculia bacterium]
MSAPAKKPRIALLPGDGIGPEVLAPAARLLSAAAAREGVELELVEERVGGAAIDATGQPLPPATLALCRESDAILLGAVGGPRWADPAAPVRPEQGLLALRQELGLFANLRPVRAVPALAELSALRPERLAGVDLLIVRELAGGLYFGARGEQGEGHEAFDTLPYSVAEVERVARVAFAAARGRRGRLTSVDKANVLATSRLWRRTVSRLGGEEFPDVALDHQLVDSFALALVSRPASLDVVLTDNLFGDILSDEAAVAAGSLGLLPSASLGHGRRGLYEPIHGSAPDIAGRGLANPLGAILSAALLLRQSLGLERAAASLEQAVETALDQGHRTADLTRPGEAAVSTEEMAAAVLAALG